MKHRNGTNVLHLDVSAFVGLMSYHLRLGTRELTMCGTARDYEDLIYCD